MDAKILQRAAVGACVANVVLLALLQFVLTSGRGAPFGLFLLFEGLWVFGAVMLFVAPRFGALGTTAWGVLAAIGAYRTHVALTGSNLAIILASLGAAVLALAFFVSLRRAR